MKTDTPEVRTVSIIREMNTPRKKKKKRNKLDIQEWVKNKMEI
jgi:hypothetical protein